MLSLIHKIPLLTTVFSAFFAVQLYRHWATRRTSAYLLWWLIGVVCYGLGTLTESLVTLFGWSEPVFKAWYILGALLGGFPLAQGSVYLIFCKRTADVLMSCVSIGVAVASVAVLLSPIQYSLVEPTRLTGRVLGWSEIRYVTPLINLYAFAFLVGGAVYSAYRYSRDRIYKNRFWGNVCIAVGGLLPGIGGSFTKFGYTEVLYVTELLGILLIYAGYRIMRHDATVSIYKEQTVGRESLVSRGSQ